MSSRQLLVAVIALTCSFAAHAFDPVNGFRDTQWGSHPNSIPDLIERETGDKQDLVLYMRRGDKLQIGAASLDEIAYAFYKNRLYSVLINFSNYENFSRIKAAMFEKYGEGYRPNRYLNKYMWSRAQIGDSTYIVFNYSDITKRGFIAYYSREVQQIKSDDEKAAAQNARHDF